MASDLIHRSLILLRGLPGSGKSTLAEVLSDGGLYPVCSVDRYFTDPITGDYTFDYSKNHLAYADCEKATKEAMEGGCSKVIVDNTFTMEWEMIPYFKLAKQLNYRLFVVTVENRHNGKNNHGVTNEQLLKMAANYNVSLMPLNEN